MSFRHTLRIRYAECDMQGVVFNAHYLAYCDDALGAWIDAVMPGAMTFAGNSGTFDMMTVKATVSWHGGLTFGEVLGIDCSVSRWGNSSFDVLYAGSVGGESRFEVVVTYVNVTPGTHTPAPIADNVKKAFGH